MQLGCEVSSPQLRGPPANLRTINRCWTNINVRGWRVVFRPRYTQIAPGGGAGPNIPKSCRCGVPYTPVCFIAYFTRPNLNFYIYTIRPSGRILHVRNSALLIIDSFDAFGGFGVRIFCVFFFLGSFCNWVE